MITSHEFAKKLGAMIREERRLTTEILQMISQASQRHVYLDLGYGSLFDWLTQYYGYSNAAAQRRIEAARLLKSVPEVTTLIQQGRINLSTLSRAQSTLRAQERATSKVISREEKRKIVEALADKSSDEAARILVARFPSAAQQAQRDRRTVVSESLTRHAVNLTRVATANLDRAKSLLSHKLPRATDADIIAYALEILIGNIAPIQKARKPKGASVTPSRQSLTRRRHIAIEKRRSVFIKAHEQCEYRDPVSGRRCDSTHQLEIDHIRPVALGGDDSSDNLRLLCRAHNQHAARRLLGDFVNRHARMRSN